MVSQQWFVAAVILLCGYSSCAGQDSRWTVSLTVSETPGADEYEGHVELLAVFEGKTQRTATLPSTKYVRGQTYTFDVQFPSAGPIQAIYIRTKGVCPLGLLPTHVLRLRRVQVASESTNILYAKETGDLAVKDACQSAVSKGTAITDLVVTVRPNNTQFCIVDGQRYENGQQFDMACTGRCRCENGMPACVDMCGTVAWEPERKCHFVHSPGRCCDRVVCEDEAQIKQCAQAQPADMTDEKGKMAAKRYPWTTVFCRDDRCKELVAGVIVGPRHILTYAMDLSRVNHLLVSAGDYFVDQLNVSEFRRMAVSNVSTHPDFVNTNSPIPDSASRLIVIELKEQFVFTKQLQAANLPFDKDHCSQLTKQTCPSMSVGWDRTDESVDDIRQWWFHAEMAKWSASCRQASDNASRTNPKGARPAVRVPVRRGDKRVCVSELVRRDCTGPLGGAVVATAAKTDFLVGLTDPDAILFPCEHPGSADVLPLCKYVSWVSQLTQEG